MQLLELTPAELAFLNVEPAVVDSLQRRLTLRLAAVLTARLRMPVQAHAQPEPDAAFAPVTPVWQPDAALASLWLTRRLGGQRATGVAPFVPRTLIHTLDEALAECWLDKAAERNALAVLAWTLAAGPTQASLLVRLPQHASEMTQWARNVIGGGSIHGN